MYIYIYIYIYICMYIVNSKLLLGETLCRAESSQLILYVDCTVPILIKLLLVL